MATVQLTEDKDRGMVVGWIREFPELPRLGMVQQVCTLKNEDPSAACNFLSKGVHFQSCEVYEEDKMVYEFNQVRNANEN